MTRVYFSTVERAATTTGAGEYVLVDWDAKRVTARAPVVPTDLRTIDPNPRGGGRGGRGMWLDGDRVYAACRDRVTVFDRELVEQRSVSNGLLVGLHEVCQERPGRLWVAATNVDAALEVDLESGGCTRSHWPREDPRLQEALELTPLELDKEADNRALFIGARVQLQDPSHLHLNAVAVRNGDVLALFNQQGVIVDLERGQVLARHELLRLGHNLVVVDDQAFVVATKDRTLCQFDLSTGRLVRSLALLDLPWVRDLHERATATPRRRWWRRREEPATMPDGVAMPLFARGLQVRGDTVYVGVAPATILQIAWPPGELVDAFEYSPEVRVAVHGLQVTDDR